MKKKKLSLNVFKRNWCYIIALSLVCIPSAVTAQTNTNQQKVTIRLAHNDLPNSTKGRMVNEFQKIIQQRLGDKVNVSIHANSSLIDDSAVAAELTAGKAEFAFPSFHDLGSVIPRFQLFDLPFLFANEKAAENFISGPYGVRLFKLLESSGLKSHGYVNSGMKQLSANRPIKVPADARGLRFAVGNSTVLEKQFRALQAKSVKVNNNQVYGYFKAGNLDGYENIWSNIMLKRVDEFQPYMLESNHAYVAYSVLTTNEFWDGLEQGIKLVLEGAIEDAIEYGKQIAREQNTIAKKKMLENGTTIHQLTVQEHQAWVDVMQPVWNSYKNQIGSELVKIAYTSR